MTQEHSKNSNVSKVMEQDTTTLAEENNDVEQTEFKDKELDSNVYSEFTQDEVLELVGQLEILKKENTKLKDDMLRGRADLENSKKRITKHYEELSREKVKLLLQDIVVLLDDFERALDAGQNTENSEALQNVESSMFEGIKMIETQFVKTLENKWQLLRFDSINEEFDPQRHEAMMSETRDDLSSPTVIAEFSKGYMVGDKLLRPAKVKVATPAT